MRACKDAAAQRAPRAQAPKRKRGASKPPARTPKATRLNPGAAPLLTPQDLPDDTEGDDEGGEPCAKGRKRASARSGGPRAKPVAMQRTAHGTISKYKTKRGLVEGTKVHYNTSPGSSEAAQDQAFERAEARAAELQGGGRSVVLAKVRPWARAFRAQMCAGKGGLA